MGLGRFRYGDGAGQSDEVAPLLPRDMLTVAPLPMRAPRSGDRYPSVVVDPEARPGLAPGEPVPPSGSELVDWITNSTRIDRTIASAIPPVFTGYATIVVPDGREAQRRADLALVDVLQARAPADRWWLGYLDTGAADLSNIAGQRVSAYVGWTYVLTGGGPQHVLAARDNGRSTPWHSALPELMFPHDRSWLVSMLWDDDWWCLGGPQSLIAAVLAHPHLDARVVNIDEDATPHGHQSY